VRLQPSVATAQDDPASARPKEGDLLVKAQEGADTPLKPGDIQGGVPPLAAWPMDPHDRTVRSGSRFNQLLLLRLDPDKLTAATRSAAADGVVAYTVICTHSGCDVDDWLADQEILSCSCHSSMFDPKDGRARCRRCLSGSSMGNWSWPDHSRRASVSSPGSCSADLQVRERRQA
jgi:rieske iron-sulfur protein